MAFTIDTIHHVEAGPFPLGQMKDGRLKALPGLMLIRWESDAAGKLHQVYVNGEFGGVTAVPEQRMMLVEYDDTHPTAIEVVAVDPEEQYTDYSDQLNGFSGDDGRHVVLQWPRRGMLSLGSVAKIYWDWGNGVIDMAAPIAEIPVWLDEVEKWGWGLDAFGMGDFGYSGAAAIGWGLGSFGDGEFGFDAELGVFLSESLTEGHYQFAIQLVDGRGNPQEEDIEIFETTIDPIPAGPTLDIFSYESEEDCLTLVIGDSVS